MRKQKLELTRIGKGQRPNKPTAMAHTMGRRRIMVELGEHCHTHIVPRLKKVVDDADKGGVTKAAGWQGGGFRYYELVPTLQATDRWGNLVTTQTLSAEQLALLSDEAGAEQTLLICCGAYRGVTVEQATERWPNLTIKKILKLVKDRCEWGHDDYSLNMTNLAMAQKPAAALKQDDLFSSEAGR